MELKSFNQQIIFKKFEIKKVISKSDFSTVYEGINITNNTPVALKIEKEHRLKLLESEAYLLINLKGFGIPEVISYGKKGSYSILIEELLGPNIYDLWERYGYKEDPLLKKNKTLKDVCMIGIQGLERLKYIHNKNVIHRDIKPKNFIIGRKDPIDFGFSQKYRSSRTGKHIKFANKNRLIGSRCFSSFNAIKGREHSRRDDLESLGYALIYLAKGRWLPWIKMDIKNNINEVISQIANMKSEIGQENLCEGLPTEFILYMKYVKNLKFEESPNYEYLNGLFLSVLTKNLMTNDLQFFWIIKPKTKKNIYQKRYLTRNKDDDSKKLNNINFRRKNSSLKRLYNKIKISLTKKEIYTNPIKKNSNYTTINTEPSYSPINNNSLLSLKKFGVIIKSKNKLNYNKNMNSINNKNLSTTDVHNSKKITFQTEYPRLKKANIIYISKEFNKIKKVNKTIIQNPKIKICNNINYNKIYLIKNNSVKDKSTIKTVNNLPQKNNKREIHFENNKLYKTNFKK